MTSIEDFRQAHLKNIREAADRLLASGDKYDCVYWDGNGKHDPEEDAKLVAEYALRMLEGIDARGS